MVALRSKIHTHIQKSDISDKKILTQGPLTRFFCSLKPHFMVFLSRWTLLCCHGGTSINWCFLAIFYDFVLLCETYCIFATLFCEMSSCIYLC